MNASLEQPTEPLFTRSAVSRMGCLPPAQLPEQSASCRLQQTRTHVSAALSHGVKRALTGETPSLNMPVTAAQVSEALQKGLSAAAQDVVRASRVRTAHDGRAQHPGC